MTHQPLPIQRGFGETLRRDLWWATPAWIFSGITVFLVYGTWAALQNAHYIVEPYISPFYAPEIFGASPHAWFGPRPLWWPGWLPFSPSLLILPFPAIFRFTCYYHRGTYYKGFWADPPNCAVGEPRTTYRGEQPMPNALQNLHRYAMYIAVVLVVLHAYDTWLALWFPDPATGGTKFGVGVGTFVMATETFLLGSYTFGCHSVRHIVGGFRDRLSGSPVRKNCYDCVSSLNARHGYFAWLSLYGIMVADLYVRLLSMGYITDWRLF